MIDYEQNDSQQPKRTRLDKLEVARTAVLFGLGLYFVVIIVTGSLSNYINIRFSWLSYVAAVIFLALGAVAAYDLLRGRRQTTYADLIPMESHYRLSWSVILIVAVPLVLGTLLPSQPLGASAIDGGIATDAVGATNSGTFNLPPLERNILDWLRAFNRSETAAAFDGLPVDVIGFVYREPDFGTTQFMVARFSISCCVADATALGIPVEWPDAPDLRDGVWVRVQGTLQAGEFDGVTLPIIRADDISIVDQPEHPYLYS